MYERLSDKKNMPTIEEFTIYIGACKDLFENIDLFLRNELNAEMKLGFSSDSSARGWGIVYKNKSKYFGAIIAEKEAFTVVMRLTDNQIKNAYDLVLPYAQNYLKNYHRTSNGGWVQYRVLSREHLDDVKKILKIRNEYK